MLKGSISDLERQIRNDIRREDWAFRVIVKHLDIFRKCGHCEFSAEGDVTGKYKRHIHFFIPVRDRERLDCYDKGARLQDYYDQMSIRTFRTMLEENGIMDAIEEIKDKAISKARKAERKKLKHNEW